MKQVAAGVVLLRHLRQLNDQLLIGLGIVEIALGVVEAALEIRPGGRVHRRGRELAKVLGHLLPKGSDGQRLSGHSDDGEILWHQAVGLQVAQRWNQLALGQIASGSEDHQGARISGSLK